MNSRLFQTAFPPAIVFVVFVAAAEAAVRLLKVPAYLVPPPSAILQTLWTDSEILWEAAGTTALSALIGFSVSAVAGVTLGVLLSAAGWVRRAFYPYAVFFQTVPIVAIAPLLLIWIGHDVRAVITSALIVSVFPVIASTVAGMRSTDPALWDMFRLYRASPLATLFKLRLPMALPSILTGLRVAAGLAVIGTIVGEFIVGGGLGGLLITANTQLRTDIVFADVLLSALMALVLFAVIGTASRILLRNWHPSERGE